ncbi:MAG: hypothetical protein HUK26_03495 [Duodenibacillus sp.]|nr:hypothetical protein [Duodenibacillus sp.]
MGKKSKTGQAASAACPCGSGRSRADCCGRFLDGRAAPADPEELMRSRYAAFAEGNDAWLRVTWAPETCPEGPLSDVAVKWLGLEVHGAGAEGDAGWVEFTARGRAGSQGAFRMRERSRFERRGGVWLYVDGELSEKP